MRRFLAAACCILFTAGCGGGMRKPSISPEDLPALEARYRADPGDPGTMLRLGIAYHASGRDDLARDVLRGLLAVRPDDAIGSLYLGRAWEGLGQLDSARAVWTRAARSEPTDDVRGALEGELEALTRKEFQAAAREAIARESELAPVPPGSNTIAVMPFRFLGEDESLRPLESGLAYLIVTDLSQVSGLRVLERQRVQALMDEMALTESGRVDPRTAARSGRLLRAGRVIQGSITTPDDGELRVEANAVETGGGEVTAEGSAQDRLQALFDIEQQVVFELLADLGVTLSPEEREAIGRRPTADMQAFLAFSRGLEAEDRGDLEAAGAAYDAAARRDRTFQPARERRDRLRRIAALDAPGSSRFADHREGPALPGQLQVVKNAVGHSAVLHNIVSATIPSSGDRLNRRLGTRLMILRKALSEALQQDDPRNLPQLGEIIILIIRP
ncbi:MAG: CsgG/HfaB family protein [Gemmatimonadales bacterium]